jgi:thiamine-monophosphate kinase
VGPAGERVVSERRAALEAAKLAGVHPLFIESDSCPWRELLASIDGYSAGESKLPWMKWSDWGWKALVASASDLAASGGIAEAVLVSIGAPDATTALEVARGAGEAARWLEAEVLGGDMNACRCGDAWIDVAVLGRRLYWSPRWSARPGDFLVRAGPLGYGAIACAALRKPELLEYIPGHVLDYTRRPKPPLQLSRILADMGCTPRAGIDNSDGWAETLWLLAEASRVRLVLDKLEPSASVKPVLEELGLNTSEAVLQSGEDYTLLLSIPPETLDCVFRACRVAGVECEAIGRVEVGEPAVVYKGKPVPRDGWDSFAGEL